MDTRFKFEKVIFLNSGCTVSRVQNKNETQDQAHEPSRLKIGSLLEIKSKFPSRRN